MNYHDAPMLEKLENGNLKSDDSNSLSPDAASVKIGGEDNGAYAGVPQSDRPEALDVDGDQKISEPARSRLASRLIGCWQRAVDTKQSNLVNEDLLECLRQFKGRYTTGEENDLSSRGLPLVYFPLSEHKVHTAIAWIDEFFTNGETLINIRPTPLPEMENDVVAQTYIQSMRDVSAVIEQTGVVPPPEMMQQYAALMRQIVEQHVDDTAKERALKMERKIRDDLVEGGWSEHIHELIGLTCTYGTAGFRCPVIKFEDKLAWKNGEPAYEKRIVRTFEAISPFDLFPAPGARDTHEGDLCVRVRYDAMSLAAMKDSPSWIKDAVNDTISAYGNTGIRLYDSTDSEREILQKQMSTVYDNGTIEGFEFWGGACGADLVDIGVVESAKGEKIANTTYDWYQINAIVVGDRVIYCRVMDKGEKRPIDSVKFYDTPGSFWGRGPLQIIRNLQRICNAAGRSLATNMSFASGPQVIVDLNSIDTRDDMKMRAFKVWATRKNAMNQSGGKPIEFFNVDSHAKELMEVFDYHQRLADELTGIPAYANGTDAAVGAARTATGLNMLMGQANRGVKKVIGNFDELVRRSVMRLVEWHMLHDKDKDAKGDITVEVTGLRYFVTKTSRANDILNLVDRITQNPALAQIPGMKRLVNLLHEVGIAMDLGAYSLAPSEDELKREQEQKRQEMMAQQKAVAAEQQAVRQQAIDGQMAIEQAKAQASSQAAEPAQAQPVQQDGAGTQEEGMA